MKIVTGSRMTTRAIVKRVADEGIAFKACLRSGLIGAEPPRRMARIVRAVARFGLLGGIVTASAIRHGSRIAVIDELGSLTFSELDERSNALANAWRARGLRAGDGVAILVRNHRGFLDATFAAAKCGARIVLLNTDFAGPQVREVAQREGVDLLVYDDEYAPALEGVEPRLGKWRAWTETQAQGTLATLIAGGDRRMPPKPAIPVKIIVLTSGTTGTPRGASRSEPRSFTLLGALLESVPFRAREVTECCAPMFHSLGFAHSVLAVALGSTLVIRRRFDAPKVLQSLSEHRGTAMVVVPVMLQRMLEVNPAVRAKLDLSKLRIIFVAGSQLGALLCTRAMEAFGPVLYNLYGSTEVAFATIATPSDLRAEPACVGPVVLGAVVKVLGDDGQPVAPGMTGRIFVGNSVQFEGYTGGGTKESIGGLMSSGDLGHFDEAGRLFIDGRSDEMIVSGGENVFPAEVEETLMRHADIVEVAALGVPDADFGQRLRVFVAIRDGAALTEQDVKDHVRANLSRFKVPRDVVFIDRLPRNPTGKVLKRQLESTDRSRSA